MKLLTNKHLFWDTNPDTINPDLHHQAIIERVLERGDWEDIKEIIHFYGRERVIEGAKKARWFDKKTMHFVSGYFNIPLSELRCYTERQLSPVQFL